MFARLLPPVCSSPGSLGTDMRATLFFIAYRSIIAAFLLRFKLWPVKG